MKQQKRVAKEPSCDDCLAYQGPAVTDVRIEKLTAIASQRVEQAGDGVWHALLTAVGKGKYFIRRRKNLAANECPLLSCEIRHIEVEAAEGHKPDSAPIANSAENHAASEACRRLLLVVLMEQIEKQKR